MSDNAERALTHAPPHPPALPPKAADCEAQSATFGRGAGPSLSPLGRGSEMRGAHGALQ